MAIETIDNFGVFVGKNIDSRYGPYANTTEANASINSIFRFKGLTVLLTGSGDQVEYWYYNGITDPDLVPKGAAISISGSDGQVIFFSGSTALSGSPNFTFDYTASTPIFNVTGAISASYGPNTVGFYGTASWAQSASQAISASYALSSSYVLSASYASSGGSITEIVAGTNITISPPEGTGSVTINSTAAAGSGVSVAATASFTNATIWNFTHNLSSRYVIIQALDNNHQQIIPETIELLDTSSARLTFPTPESGYAMATIGGTTASVALTSLEVLTNNGGAIYDIGNDLVIEPFNNLIISGNMIPGPPYTANTSSYDLGSPTAAWNHLYVANGSVVFVTGSNTAEIQYNGTHITTTKPISGSFTGSLFGTSSWSTNALTASYVNPLRQDVTITGSLLLTQSHISTVDYIDYRVLTAIQQPAHAEGRTHWLDDTKTLQIDTDVNNFSIEVGHQSVVRARNTTGFDLTAGKVVYINGESGNRPTITTASWDGDPTSAATLGFVAQQINDNQTGYVVTNGMLRGINTNAFAPGTQLYLSSSGGYTSTVPVSPKHEVRLGKTITQATDGVIYVDIMNGYELGELHDVLINSSTNGDLLIKSGSLWINSKQLTGSYGLTGSLALTSGDVTASIFASTNNGNGTNFKVGDDAWIGDINTADTLQIRGQQNGGKGYIKFGTGSSNPIIGTDGTSVLEITNGYIKMSSRPAFRVVGTTTTGIAATTTITSTQGASIDYNQGSHYNNTTGIFTAPVAGLYHVFFNSRTKTAGQQQVIIYKNTSVAQMMWETDTNTGHFGISSILSLAVNDTLEAKVTVGTIQFDGNDNWGAAYIG